MNLTKRRRRRIHRRTIQKELQTLFSRWTLHITTEEKLKNSDKRGVGVPRADTGA